MKKSILVGLVFSGLFFIASTSFAYQPGVYPAFPNLLNPFPAFSSARSLNEETLGRLLREILYLFTLLRQIEAEIQNTIGKGADITPPLKEIAKKEPGSSQGNLPSDTAEPTQPEPQPPSSTGDSGSSGTVKIVIIDIDPEHAAQVRAVMEETIRRQNPGADVEIRTIILPGEWQADGSKAVAGSAILSALGEAKAWGARVVNMSIGCADGLSRPILTALRDLRQSGILVVAASGNEGGRDAWAEAGSDVLSVGANRPDGRRAVYSNYADIYRVVSGPLQGTSFAAPIVAAEAALALLGSPSLTVADLTALLGSGDTMYAAGTPRQNNTSNVYTSSLDLFIPPFFYVPAQEPAFSGLGFYSPQFSYQIKRGLTPF